MERIEYDLLFRWFVGLGIDDPAWDHSSFTKNRDRLLDGRMAAKLLEAVLAQPRVKQLLSSDHFSVDGTLIEAWASVKSFRRKDVATGTAMVPAAMPNGAFTGEALERDPMRARPIRKPGSTGRAMGSRRGSATWVIALMETAMAWRSAAG